MFKSQLRRLALFSSRNAKAALKAPLRTSTVRSTETFLTNIVRNYSITTQGTPTTDHITELSTNEFHNLSGEYLETLFDYLELLGETHTNIDVEYSQGVLSLDLPPNGSYVINKQPPNKQIWLSSPVSGPDRFDPVHGNWISLRTGLKLGDVLREEVSAALAEKVTLEGLDDK